MKVVKLILIWLLIFSNLTIANDKKEVIKATNAIMGMVKTKDWITRTTLNFYFEDNFKPKYRIETIQPLFNISGDELFFWQLNARTRDLKEVYNLGVGYRNIILPELIFGLNVFYDYATKYEHKRGGIGAELIGYKYEARANLYRKISPKREIEDGVYQEVLGGFDIEFGGNILPSFDDFKAYLSYSRFNAKETENLKTKKIRFTYQIRRDLDLEFGYISDNNRDIRNDRYFTQITLKFGKGKKKIVYSNNLKSKLLQPVKREYDIIIEETRKKSSENSSPSASGTISVKFKRGN